MVRLQRSLLICINATYVTSINVTIVFFANVIYFFMIILVLMTFIHISFIINTCGYHLSVLLLLVQCLKYNLWYYHSY